MKNYTLYRTDNEKNYWEIWTYRTQFWVVNENVNKTSSLWVLYQLGIFKKLQNSSQFELILVRTGPESSELARKTGVNSKAWTDSNPQTRRRSLEKLTGASDDLTWFQNNLSKCVFKRVIPQNSLVPLLSSLELLNRLELWSSAGSKSWACTRASSCTYHYVTSTQLSF